MLLPVQIEILSERQSQPASQLKFVIEAWMQVCMLVHTRRRNHTQEKINCAFF